MTPLEQAATELVRYAGAAARIEPIGTIAVPLRLVRDLRVALEAEHRARVREIPAGGAR